MSYGDLGKRILAWLIDCIFISVVISIVEFILYFFGLFWFFWWFWPTGLSIVSLFQLFYYVLMEGGDWHATLGKKAMGLYVSDENGKGVTYSTALIRNLCKVISTITFCIGYIICFFDDKKQCMHDKIAKTYILEGNAEEIGMGPKLICVKGASAGMMYNITKDGLLIGRDSVSCQVVVPPNQKNISRIHCFVTYNSNSDMFIINDRKSSCGTYLSDGRRIEYFQPTAVRSGTKFYLANPNYMFEVR